MQKHIFYGPALLSLLFAVACSEAEDVDTPSANDAATSDDSAMPVFRYDAEIEDDPDDPRLHRDAQVDSGKPDATVDANVSDSSTAEDATVDASEQDAIVSHECTEQHTHWDDQLQSCQCDNGWMRAGTSCIDINECSSDSTLCNFAHGRCHNTQGGYECQCEDFWSISRTGDECIDINECSHDDSLCKPHGQCVNISVDNPTANSLGYTCNCDSGYILNPAGNGCIDLDECASNLDDCGSVACVNSEGAYSCDCGANGTYAGNGNCSCNNNWTFDNNLGACTPLNFIQIDGGSFQMGSTNDSSSSPIHEVTVPTFFMTKTEITNAEYKKCVNAGACTAAHYDSSCSCQKGQVSDFQGNNQPVVCITWDQAANFASWADARLPSEAEWEFAARGIHSRSYPWGSDEPSCTYAIMKEGSTDYYLGCNQIRTWDVCSKTSGNSPEGLCDLIGNAAEWIQDNYAYNYTTTPNNGSAFVNASFTDHPIRGGAWSHSKATGLLTSTFRDYNSPSTISCEVGFRLAHDAN